MNRKSLAVIGVILVLTLEVAVLALPALALTSSFTWTCQFNHRCVSRVYSASAGTQTITKTDADCPGVGNRMRVRIVQNKTFGDVFYPWQTIDCGPTNVTRSWLANNHGDYHFDIEKDDTADTVFAWTVYGRTTYQSP